MVLVLSVRPLTISHHRKHIISSKPVPLLSGVPLGSVLGPILFALFTQPLSNTTQTHQFDYHKYADDIELQKAAFPSDFSQLSRETEVCVADVKEWMNKYKLKLNEEKTAPASVKKEPLPFGPNAVPLQTSAKHLGVYLISSRQPLSDHTSQMQVLPS